jgi:hypothetical protein
MNPDLPVTVWRFQVTQPRSWYPSEIIGSRHTPSVGFGGDWFGIERFNLRTHEHQIVMDETTMRLPPGFVGGWVSCIMSVSAGGALAVCQVGLNMGGKVRYFVCELEIPGGGTTLIAELPSVWA